MKKNILLVALLTAFILPNATQAQTKKVTSATPFVWEGANLYFLLTDRFNNGDSSNDINYNRNKETGKLRGFMGGDVKGITQKIEEGYFDQLGINAIWMTPLVEQIHDGTDEGTGFSYGFHGYWAKDWTALDPNFGTAEEVKNMVEKAHQHGIRIVFDGVINHTGPVTPQDALWPENWVRTSPACDYKNYKNTTACTLVANLPDILTESEQNVELPTALVEKWKKEGRYEQEVKELDAFFARTGYPRAPKYYIIKWLTDYITEYGIDGYRADTTKHLEEGVWGEFKKQCDYAFTSWKQNNPGKVLDNTAFYTTGEVSGYNISGGLYYDFGDKKVNYFANGFNSLINFEFKNEAKKDYESLFSYYSNTLQNDLKGFGVLNYVSSHDDSTPFDGKREKTFESATKLLLTPGTAQVYYGDESGRNLVIEGTKGDATLRSFMNWEDIKNNPTTQKTLAHWQKLGQFRKNHPAVGAGVHQKISASPYVFSRTYSKENYSDQVVVGLDLTKGKKTISTGTIFQNGATVIDAYSGKEAVVTNGKVTVDSEYDLVLLELKK
ncbi:MAG: alpha-amylase [Flavobacterium sp.]|nr:alpha-amylase [Flavobacterium sp.]